MTGGIASWRIVLVRATVGNPSTVWQRRQHSTSSVNVRSTRGIERWRIVLGRATVGTPSTVRQ